MARTSFWTPKTKRNATRILPFGLIWLVLGWIFITVEIAAVNDPGNIPSSAIQVNSKIMVFASITTICLGLLVGAIELLFLNRLFAKQSLFKKILFKMAIYIGFMYMVIMIAFPVAASMELETSVLDNKVWDKYYDFLSSKTHLSTLLQMGVSLFASLFYAEISENLGHGVLLNFFTGKYHKPKEEERVFMFADMKSSTTIAEKLGHIQYFELLKDYYLDFSEAIIEHSGEVYQYVGDEIVLSWKLEKGIMDNNCLRCFFKMKMDLKRKHQRYLKRFGVFPDFKAGIHFGKVTTGEIGALKKEIIFTGDVLNTTARLQSLCSVYGVDLIISNPLLELLEIPDGFNIKSLGEQRIKGKEKRLSLSTVIPIP